MLEYAQEPRKTRKKIDLPRLKEEIKALSGELRFLKSRIRDPELNQAIYDWYHKNSKDKEPLAKELNAAQLRRWRTRLRFNKLVTLRALMRGRIHFHKNTRFEEVDYRLVRLGRFPTKDDLWAWVDDVRKEFEI